jgi:hypothetical protein
MLKKPRTKCTRRPRLGGFSLLETVIATGLMCAVSSGLMSLAAVALQTTENQGHLLSRTVEYGQDKIEQLLALAFSDGSSNTTVVPTTSTGGNGLTNGGSSSPSSPAFGYVDYVDGSGNVLSPNGTTAPAGALYVRVWSIAAGPAGVTNEKLITVTTRMITQVGSAGALPQSTIAALKVNPF